MSTFGATLRTDRERLKMSQDQLADLLGVSQQAVANWEAGVSMPRRERRARLLQILGPGAELTKNPPRYEFIPSEDRPVSQPTRSLTGEHTEPADMAANPDFPRRLPPSPMHLVREERFREFRARLPKELHAYVNNRVTIGAQTRELDYLSPRWGIEVKPVRDRNVMSMATGPALVRLAVIRGIADQGLRPPREYALILVSENGPMQASPGLQRLMFDAGVMGISVYQVESFAQAGDLVRQLESGEDVADETPDDPASGADHPDEGSW